MHPLHYNRKDALSKAFFDVFKLTLVAGFASKFFADFEPTIKIVIAITGVLSFFLGFIFCPNKKEA